jgi:tagaturonate reductase
MEILNKMLFEKENLKLTNNLVVGPLSRLPEKVLQFGEGNFLRGFVDWMINKLNDKGLFNGSVVVVQPIREGLVNMINDQDGLYTLLLRGIQSGDVVQNREIITSISRGLDIYSDFNEYLKLAESDQLRVIISNTTEAGIAYNPDDKFEDTPPESFPGKLTVFLYKRFKAFGEDVSKGLIIIPWELIERNGDNLKKVVIRLANEWKLGSEFIEWIEKANYFLNTLVDRIVTGYPKDEIEALPEELGYKDNLIDTGEIFHLWVIEGDKKLAKELPFNEAGLNVIWTDDMTPYRTRKVRILNGAHTMTVLAAHLYGIDTVKDCMDDKLISTYMRKGIFDEIIPTLDLPENELAQYARDVLERFSNPFIKHYLLSISLNSTSKFKTRVLPSILEYVDRRGEMPKILIFSLATLFAFYKGSEIRNNSLIGTRNGSEYKISDDMPVLEAFKGFWDNFDGTKEGIELMVSKLLGKTDWWGSDLNEVKGLTDLVSKYLFNIVFFGIEKALKDVVIG